MKSWKTSLGGAAGVVAALVAVAQVIANSPGDGIDYNLLGPSLATAIAAIFNSISLIFARDDKVSSQDVGIRPVSDRTTKAFGTK